MKKQNMLIGGNGNIRLSCQACGDILRLGHTHTGSSIRSQL